MPDALEQPQRQQAEEPEAPAPGPAGSHEAAGPPNADEQADDMPRDGAQAQAPGAAGEPQPGEPVGRKAPAFQPTAVSDADNLRRMLDVPLDMTVELGRTQMQLSDVLSLQPGSIIELDRVPGEAIDLSVNGRLFAKGEVVVIKDTFGYRVIELVGQAPAGDRSPSHGEASLGFAEP
jgi:flagellar motor switch protein FliN/FliY